MGSEAEGRVVVLCLGGIVSELCSSSVEARLDETDKVLRAIDSVWSGEEEEKLVLLVSPGLQGFPRLLGEMEELGYNHFLVEATGVPETMLSGLPLDEVIGYWVGFLVVTEDERRAAKRVRPRITRREALRRLFLVTPRHVILPRVEGGCSRGGVCPYGALGERGLDEAGCRGCMLCAWRCPEAVRAPEWTGPLGLLYAYRFVAAHSLDGILFICRRSLDRVEEAAVEASPARLLPFHVPCASWLGPGLLRSLREDLGVNVYVYRDPERCGECWLREAGEEAAKDLASAGVPVSRSMSQASMAAFSGYGRRKRSMEEVATVLAEALRGMAAAGAGAGSSRRR